MDQALVTVTQECTNCRQRQPASQFLRLNAASASSRRTLKCLTCRYPNGVPAAAKRRGTPAAAPVEPIVQPIVQPQPLGQPLPAAPGAFPYWQNSQPAFTQVPLQQSPFTQVPSQYQEYLQGRQQGFIQAQQQGFPPMQTFQPNQQAGAPDAIATGNTQHGGRLMWVRRRRNVPNGRPTDTQRQGGQILSQAETFLTTTVGLAGGVIVVAGLLFGLGAYLFGA
ncbi:Uu.00g061480.m01.CDS01 [Anthostomella pinea]|uniref:Uu.00g061480.m01.CDS01 n=1 Tax=Anthostomella pinea TaxID=933095 RepID=A0AAI8YMF3_9PEZI|nr:Uu.00g061480.m01.CDS01 [Anthostomella pinea]